MRYFYVLSFQLHRKRDLAERELQKIEKSTRLVQWKTAKQGVHFSAVTILNIFQIGKKISTSTACVKESHFCGHSIHAHRVFWSRDFVTQETGQLN